MLRRVGSASAANTASAAASGSGMGMRKTSACSNQSIAINL